MAVAGQWLVLCCLRSALLCGASVALEGSAGEKCLAPRDYERNLSLPSVLLSYLLHFFVHWDGWKGMLMLPSVQHLVLSPF